MTEVPTDQPLSHPFRVAALPTRKPMRFSLSPDAPTRAARAESLGLLQFPVFRFAGELRSSGRHDFILEATLEAKIVQPCSVSLAPVPATISEKVTRRYLADYVVPEGDEVEMPEDDTTDPLPEVIDVGVVALRTGRGGFCRPRNRAHHRCRPEAFCRPCCLEGPSCHPTGRRVTAASTAT